MTTNPQSFKKFKKVPLFLAVIFLAVSILSLYWISTQIDKNEELSKEAQTAWEKEETHRYEIQGLKNLLKDIAKEKAEIDSYFASSKNVVPFLDSMQALARRVGATSEIQSLDSSQGEFIVVMNAEGSFEALYKLLELLENSPYELEFLTVDFTKQTGEDTSDWQVFFKIKLLSFIP